MSNVTQFPGSDTGEQTKEKPELLDVALFPLTGMPSFFKDVVSIVIMPTPTENIMIMNWLDGKTQGMSMKNVVTYTVEKAAERSTLQ